MVNFFPNFWRTVPNIQNSISRQTNPNFDSGKGVKTFTGKAFLNIVFHLVILIFRTGKCQLRRIYVNKNRSCKYKRIILIIIFTKQINWRGKLLVNINENFFELFFTNTDELCTEQVNAGPTVTLSVISNHPETFGHSLDVVYNETFEQ